MDVYFVDGVLTKGFNFITLFGSGTLPGLFLYLGLLEISLVDVFFFIFLAPAGHYPNLFNAGQS